MVSETLADDAAEWREAYIVSVLDCATYRELLQAALDQLNVVTRERDAARWHLAELKRELHAPPRRVA
jgi:hypothetical protein